MPWAHHWLHAQLCPRMTKALGPQMRQTCSRAPAVLGWKRPHPGRGDTASLPAALASSDSRHFSTQDWNVFLFWNPRPRCHTWHCFENPATGSSEINFIDFVHRRIFEFILFAANFLYLRKPNVYTLGNQMFITFYTLRAKCFINISKSMCEPCKMIWLCFLFSKFSFKHGLFYISLQYYNQSVKKNAN